LARHGSSRLDPDTKRTLSDRDRGGWLLPALIIGITVAGWKAKGAKSGPRNLPCHSRALSFFRRSARTVGRESQLFELKRHIEAAGVIAPSFFHWLSVDRWRPLRSAAGCSRTLPGGGVRRRARRGWHVIAKCEDGNSGHHDPDDKCRQEPSAAVSVTERSLSVGVQAWIGLLRLSVGRLAIDHLFLPVVGPTRP
jgi:hypothetical protein